MLLTIIIFVAVLALLVLAHEAGHFFMARKFGVKAEEFGFGFPPRVFGIYKNAAGKWKFVWSSKNIADAKDTVYSINWLPLGGFVKIKGENGGCENESDSFACRPVWQRAFMLSAGVAMNVILAAALISIGFIIGLPHVLDGDLDARARVRDKKIQIARVMDNSPAESAGIQSGDLIIGVNGKNFENYHDLQDYTVSNIGNELLYKIKRGSDLIEKRAAPAIMPDSGKAGIGIAIVEIGMVSYPWHLAAWEGVKTTFILTWEIVSAFYDFFKGLILGRGAAVDLSGPVGIATMTGQVAKMGFVYLLQFTALLSINLAVINFFPFPALDGGRVLFLAIEKIKRSPVKKEIESAAHNIGFVLLMILVLVVTFRDVAKLSNGFKNIFEKIF